MARKVTPTASKGGKTSDVAPAADESLLSGAIFSSVRGHDSVITLLTDALARHRLASTLLFVGPGGTGKRRVALGLAQSLVCGRATEEKPLACGQCGDCIRVAKLQSENVLLVEPQGANLKIEQAQEILRFIALRQLGRARIVIINEAHLLNPQAGNALLKSLEEPPPGTYFILVTSHPGAVLSTIRSRAQAIRFQSLEDNVVKDLTGAEDWIVRAAQGSAEGARRLLENSDEWVELRRLAIRVLRELLEEQSSAGLVELREKFKDRIAALFVVQVWLRAFRDFAFVASTPDLSSARLLLPDQSELAQVGARLPREWVHQLLGLCLDLEQDIQRNVDKMLALDTFSLAVAGAAAGREPRPVLG